MDSSCYVTFSLTFIGTNLVLITDPECTRRFFYIVRYSQLPNKFNDHINVRICTSDPPS